jgi:LytS/YehU family sensor histidine kinase
MPVWKELEVLQLYIELEQIRCDYHFEYAIETSNELLHGDFKIPPSLLQPFVENAILHGLIPKERKGKLVLKSFIEEEYLVFEISDDGIGREKSKEMKQQIHTSGYKSYGMNIASTRIEIYNQLKSNQAGIEIIDLVNNGIACGTKVIVKIKL